MTQAISKLKPKQMIAAAVCAHCSLEVPRGLVRPDKDTQFCCQGCETVYRTIHECGLSEYYRLRDVSTDDRVRPELRESAFSEFDEQTFQSIYVQLNEDGTKSIDLLLENVHCAACVWLVERLPAVLAGVVEARLNLSRRIVTVRWIPEAVPLSRVAATLNALGYRPHPAKGVSVRQTQVVEVRRLLTRIAIAGFCAGNVMLLSFALYGGAVEGVENQYGHLFRWLAMAFAFVSLAGPGSVFFRGAWGALRARSPHLDLPIAIALLAGGISGSINTIRGSGEVYFDSITALVFLLLIGRFVQQRQLRSAADAVELLHAFTPSTAHLTGDDGERDVPVEALRIGDRVRVRAGETVPADGAVTEGDTTLDRALLTGESVPVRVGAGDRVAAGALNVSSPIVVSIEATGTETRIGRLMDLVAEASSRKAPLLTLANRIAGVFTIVVLLLAGTCFALLLPLGLDVAAERSIALLIVCCPCALGLATPLAMTAAIGKGARRGIMIKGADALERLAGTGSMFLDKTGTVTIGRFAVVDVAGDRAVLAIAAALEACTVHPIAAAMVEAFAVSDHHTITDIVHTPGHGLCGQVDGRAVCVGSPESLASGGVNGLDKFAQSIRDHAEQAQTPVAIAVDGMARAVVFLADQPRDDAPGAIANLRHLGWTVSLLSGDDDEVTRRTASMVGLDHGHAIGRATPESKLQVVEETPDLCVMVGDGVNDAAALAAADVGIAVHGGAEASLEAADVYLNRPGLGPVLETLRMARHTRRVILTCLAVSLTYNAVAATLAFMGFIGPIAAAVLMPISSIAVLAIASRAGAARNDSRGRDDEPAGVKS